MNAIEKQTRVTTSRGNQFSEGDAMIASPGQRSPHEGLRLLNDAFGTEIVCALRYRRHHFILQGISACGVAGIFLLHSNEEQWHADQISARIVRLGGIPTLCPDKLRAFALADIVSGTSVQEMIVQNLIAERFAVETYREMIGYFSSLDSATRILLEGILIAKQEHAADLSVLLETE